MDKVTKRRLEKLIEFMESLPKSANEHFSMRAWFQHNGPDDEHGFDVGEVEIKAKHLTMCGTSACALGWAATMPYFRRLGLKAVYGEWGSELRFDGALLSSDSTDPLFNLSSEESEALFGSFVDVATPKQWAMCARKIVREISDPQRRLD